MIIILSSSTSPWLINSKTNNLGFLTFYCVLLELASQRKEGTGIDMLFIIYRTSVLVSFFSFMFNSRELGSGICHLLAVLLSIPRSSTSIWSYDMLKRGTYNILFNYVDASKKYGEQ